LIEQTHDGGTMTTSTQTMTAYLCVKGAADAIKFYEEVFGATVHGPPWLDPADGRIGHSELHLGGSQFYLSDEYPELDVLSPTTRGGHSVSFVVIVDDVDAVWARAIERGAMVDRDIEVGNGMRSGWLQDPWGHRWNIGELLDGDSEE
jgi:PhnB protein